MSELIIRRAQPDDAEQILSYMNKIGGQSDNLLFGKDGFKSMSVERERAFIEKFGQNASDVMFVGESGGKIVALSSLQTFGRKRIAHRADLAISVDKDYWGQKIGKRLMSAMIDFAKTSDIEVIELQVRSDNERAKALYTHFGFEKIGTYKKFFKIGKEYFDAELMNLYL